MLYIIACSGPNYPERVDKLRKLARIFYKFTSCLSPLFVPYIELGSCLQHKSDLKGCDELEKGGCLPGGSLMPLSFECH